jgi:dTDP-4-amino-4,6-dideoxygalactose transaminase
MPRFMPGLAAFCFALTMFLLSGRDGIFRSLCASAPLVFIGEISYSIYMLQWFLWVGSKHVLAKAPFFAGHPYFCYGDGGAVFTNDRELAGIIRSLRVHGQGADKYDNVRVGLNARLDTIQAAILLEKLSIFPGEIARRNEIARRYTSMLSDVAIVPEVLEDCVSTWAQYTIRVPESLRDAVRRFLSEKKIPTAIYYPVPLHRQTAYKDHPVAQDGLPVSEMLAGEVISLPMHPYLSDETQDYIVAASRQALDPFKASRRSLP